jgi:L-threonylcarbamoyladenylate synthase
MNAAESPMSARRVPDDVIARAVEVLRQGGVIAMPTDTVYGLAAALDHPEAIERIFSVKGRSGTKAVPVLVSSLAAFERLARRPGRLALRLAERLWPGALTIVVEASDAVPAAVRRDGMTVGVRMPASADALELIERAGGALAVTSANRSGDREARSADEVREWLGSRLDLIVDGGQSPDPRPSTVIDACREPVRILRIGAVPSWRIDAVLAGERPS